MNIVLGLLAAFFLFATLYCLLGIVVPSIPLVSRERAAILCLASGVGFLVFLGAFKATLPPPTPAELQVREKQRAKALRAREQRRAEEQARQADKQRAKEIAAANREAVKTQAKCEDTAMAFFMSQTFVKQQLRAPATAEFPRMSDSEVEVKYIGDCTHEVRAYVDAQNVFSAQLRNRYFVKLQNQRGTETWRALDVRIVGQ